MTTEWEEKQLGVLLKAARCAPVPGARARALSAMTAAASASKQSATFAFLCARAQKALLGRRSVPVAAFLAVLVTSGLWLFPRRPSAALADVAQAMANVESAHLIGWDVDRATGRHYRIEGWVQGPSKCRMRTEGGEDVIDDGEKVVIISKRPNFRTATIRPSGEFPGVASGLTYLDLFRGPEAIRSTLVTGGLRVTSSALTKLGDGRRVTAIELSAPLSPDSGKRVMTVDADTHLLLAWEDYGGDGELRQKVERIEYNVEIPDLAFRAEIPEDAVVIDLLSPPSADVRAKREQIAERLQASGGDQTADIPTGQCGTPYHSNLWFECMDRDGIMVHYLPSRNVYHVLGRALVRARDESGFWRIVADAEFEAPTSPDSSPEMLLQKYDSLLSPEEKARREAKDKELREAGAELLSKDILGRCSTPYHPGLWFKSLAAEGFDIYYLPDRNVYYVMGEALVYGEDFEEVMKDAEFQAPSEPKRPR